MGALLAGMRYTAGITNTADSPTEGNTSSEARLSWTILASSWANDDSLLGSELPDSLGLSCLAAAG